MSFLGSLFGGGSKPAVLPAPVQATPRISDASAEAASREEAARLKNRSGTSSTMLTSGLGDTNAGANIQRTSALGGNSSLTQ